MVVQMICYVYVQKLLQLSNDIEENPGSTNINEIVDSTLTVRADCNQGNNVQRNKAVNIWDSSILNTLLDYGNNL